jgi:DNA polymerase-1
MSKRLVIIDGKSVFYRSYYAMPNLSTSDGTPTGGVYGFAVLALEVVKRLKPDYVCVAWDKAKTNIRHRLAIYPEYKAGRKPPPADFYEQIPVLQDLLKSLGWPLYEADDLEADDIMGIFAKQAGKKGIESYLITSDLDVLQLINAHTHIYTLKKGLTNIDLFNEGSFAEKYGIGPHQWVDVKALKGDSSDNIPGVPGIGEKGAIDLIKQYETLDGVYENLELLKPALKAKLEAGRDSAYMSKKLVTLVTEDNLTLDLDKAKLHDGVSPEFVALLRKLEFRQLLRQAEQAQSDANTVVPEAIASTITAATEVAFTPLDYANTQPRIVAMSPDATALWVSTKPGEFSSLTLEDLGEKDIATLASGPVIGHKLKSLLRTLLAHDVTWPGTVGHDAGIAAFLLNSLRRSLELGDILDAAVEPDNAGQVVAAIWTAYQDQTAQFKDLPAIAQLARDVEFPTIQLLATIEHRGILLDSEYLHKMSKTFEQKIGALERNIYAHAGKEFTIGSPAQLARILYEELQLPTQGIKRGKTGYSTGAAELDKLRALHPIINLITEYREYTKLKSTYIDALPKLVDSEGKLHTTYALDVAATGRLSSHDPNLQNIPTRTELGQAIRTAFVPAPGNVFISADYSQFELRLAACMADDKQMIADFNKDIDIHQATAAQVYGVPLDQVTKDMRRHAKTVNFGILYGMSPHGLSAATGMTFLESKEFITKYFEVREPIKRYMERVAQEALEKGYVETMFGRRRPTPDMKSSNFMVREGAKRAAINMPIQGTEADLMKMAMLDVEKKLDGLGQQILQIHDSILVEAPKENAAQVAAILKETMEAVHKLPVKLQVDVSTGTNWGEL